VPMESAPINPQWIIEKSPKARCAVIAQGNGVTSGYWDCTAGTFLWHYEKNEVIKILEGKVALRDVSDPKKTYVHLNPPSVVQIEAGAVIEWTVTQYVLKFYVESEPNRSLFKRFLGVR
jgi:uncharacterized cupin superfamily protein